jgi:hypothetical protein
MRHCACACQIQPADADYRSAGLQLVSDLHGHRGSDEVVAVCSSLILWALPCLLQSSVFAPVCTDGLLDYWTQHTDR